MEYQSTRGGQSGISSARAIITGLASDKGLFVPKTIPELSSYELAKLASCGYIDAAKLIFSKFLTDFSQADIDECVKGAYSGTFRCDEITESVRLTAKLDVLELWHGPTCAFKDVALQALPRLMVKSLQLEKENKKVVILVATSGDTGKAALEGFKDVDGTEIVVFYPREGVSEIQRRQMITQEGANVRVCAVEGNFDDAQNAVKTVFADAGTQKLAAARACLLSSANSINWGRLLPQIVYYVKTACALSSDGERINFAVPTGNFGNILACYYALRMGAPIGKMICASNANNVLTDFIRTGVYDRNRHFFKTLSPSMDILISSNLERLLYELSGHDAKEVSGYMAQLAESGRYEVSDEIKSAVNELFFADFCSDLETQRAIRGLFESFEYVCDTHTGVAYGVYNKYLAQCHDGARTVIVSTASPYKFPRGVLAAFAPERCGELSDDYSALSLLSTLAHTSVPAPLSGLSSKPVLHESTIKPGEAKSYVASILGE